jgi:hypothetical protein
MSSRKSLSLVVAIPLFALLTGCSASTMTTSAQMLQRRVADVRSVTSTTQRVAQIPTYVHTRSSGGIRLASAR